MSTEAVRYRKLYNDGKVEIDISAANVSAKRAKMNRASEEVNALIYERFKAIPIKQSLAVRAEKLHWLAVGHNEYLIDELVRESVDHGMKEAMLYYAPTYRPTTGCMYELKKCARRYLRSEGKKLAREGVEKIRYAINSIPSYVMLDDDRKFFHYFLVNTGLVDLGYKLTNGSIEYGLPLDASGETVGKHPCVEFKLSDIFRNFIADRVMHHHQNSVLL